MKYQNKIKGTVSVIYPCNIYTLNNVEDIVVFLGLKEFCSMSICFHFCRETTIENSKFSKLKTLITNLYLTRQTFRVRPRERFLDPPPPLLSILYMITFSTIYN